MRQTDRQTDTNETQEEGKQQLLRERTIYNREETKTYQMVYTKRRRVENFDTVPYGY